MTGWWRQYAPQISQRCMLAFNGRSFLWGAASGPASPCTMQ